MVIIYLVGAMKHKLTNQFLAAFLILQIPFYVWGQSTSTRDSLQTIIEDERSTPSEVWHSLKDLIAIDRKQGWDSLLNYAQQSFEIANKHLPDKIAESAIDVAMALENKGRFEEMIKYCYIGLDHCPDGQYPAIKARIYRALGNVFFRQGQYQKSKHYQLQSYSIYSDLRDTTNMVIGLNGISCSYDSINTDSVRFYLHAALDLALYADVKEELPMIYNNLASLVEFDSIPGPEILGFLKKSYLAAVEIGRESEIIRPAVNLAFVNNLLSRFDSAKYYAEIAIDLYDKDRDELNDLAEAYMKLSEAHEGMGEIEDAFFFYKKAYECMDTLKARIFTASINEIEAKYLNEERIAQLAQKDLRIEQEANLRNRILYIGLILILGLATLLWYLKNRHTIREKEAAFSLQIERKEAQKLRELDQLKSNFFANISHEFRTPLTLLLGPLEEMDEGRFKGDSKRYYAMMLRNGRRLLSLINQLLDLSKLEGGKVNLELQSLDLGRFMRQLAGSMESWADRKDIDYEVEVTDVIPPVLTDPDKLEKVVVNLLSNALKFTPEEGMVHFQVGSYSTDKKEIVTIRVSDSGIGIREEDLPHIFGRFYQSGKQEDNMAGTGIGLALTKELVQLLEGTIAVESKVGVGTTFTLELPMTRAGERVPVVQNPLRRSRSLTTTPGSTNEVIQQSPPRPSIAKPLVLVSEDNADLRAYIRDQLSELYQVEEAADGQRGWERALELIPDLVITDVMMPNLTGTELTNQLKTDARTSHIPVIMLTAKADREDRLEGLETGADDYLLKPFDAEELRVRIRNLIEQRRKLRERFSQTRVISPKEIAVTSVDEQFLEKLMEVIEEHMDNEELTIEELGKQVGLSRSQLHRKLKALTNQSPSVFLRTVRLQRAQYLLGNQAGNVSEVAFSCGFSSIAYFSKCFKDQYRVTPMEVLAKARERERES